MATTVKIGKIVTYSYENGEIFPAIIVKLNEDNTVNLHVFKEGSNAEYIANYSLEGGQE